MYDKLLCLTDQSTEEPSRLFFWIKNKNETYINDADLNFDPSSDWHQYRIVINENEPNPYPVCIVKNITDILYIILLF